MKNTKTNNGKTTVWKRIGKFRIKIQKLKFIKNQLFFGLKKRDVVGDGM